MANVKISDLPAATGLNTTDIVPIVQSGVTKRTTAGAFTDTMTGFLQSGTGAIAGTVQDELRAIAVNAVTQFGLSTSSTGAANYTALSNALTKASGRILYIPAGNYSINPLPGILTLGCLMVGDGRNKTILTVSGNGDLFQRSTNSVMRDLTVDMVGATYSGHGCKFAAASSDQMDINVDIKNAAATKQALLFEADGGSEFNSYGSSYYTLGALGTVAAVKVNGTDAAAVPRKFYGPISSGGTLFDFGGANNFFASGFYTNGLIFGTGSSHVMLNNFRNGSAGGTVTFKGSQHVISGISAASLVNQATNSILEIQSPSWDITDTGTGNAILVKQASYTPTWTGSVANPVYGNATVNARYSRQGGEVRVAIAITMGGATTFGTGNWFFSLPFVEDTTFVQTGGSGYANAAGGLSVATITTQVVGGSQKVQLFTSALANIGSATPGVWAAGDTLRFSFSYYCA